MSKSKVLYLLTSNFPFGHGEEFLETEIKYLSKRFDRINIISFSGNTNVTRKVPKNVKVFHHKKTKKTVYLKFAYALFSKDFIDEIKNIKYIYKLKLNYNILFQLLKFILKSEEQFQYIRGGGEFLKKTLIQMYICILIGMITMLMLYLN